MKTFVPGALLLLSACAPDTSTWQPLGVVEFGEDGLTAPLDVPADSVLRVTAAGATCFQLAGATDVDGQVLAHRYSGPDCADCTLRTSVAVGAGLFAVAGASQVTFGLVDCETLTPTSSSDEAVTIDLQPHVVAPQPASLSLRLVLTASSSLNDAAPRTELEQAVNGALEGVVTARFTSVETIAAPDDKVRFHTGSSAMLASLRAVAPLEGVVDVVVAGCLQYDDPHFGPPTSVDGYTPRIPGGVGAADAVFLPDLDCTTRRSLSLPLGTRARVLAHELGHYLGLFHADGANLMNPNPALAGARGLTEAQRSVVRAHPVLQQP